MSDDKRPPSPWQAFAATVAGATVLVLAGAPPWVGAPFGLCVALAWFAFHPAKP